MGCVDTEHILLYGSGMSNYNECLFPEKHKSQVLVPILDVDGNRVYVCPMCNPGWEEKTEEA